MHTALVTVAPEPAVTSPGRRAGYGSLGAVKGYGHRGLSYKKLAARLHTVNIQPKALPTDIHALLL